MKNQVLLQKERKNEESSTPPERKNEDNKEEPSILADLVHACMSMKMKKHFKKHLTL
jgi:hypothetical protein